MFSSSSHISVPLKRREISKNLLIPIESQVPSTLRSMFQKVTGSMTGKLPYKRYEIDFVPIVCNSNGMLIPPRRLHVGEYKREKYALILELYEASYIGNKDKVVYTLQTGCLNVNHGSRDGWTPLAIAVCRGHLDIVITLLDDFHAEIDKSVRLNGMTPLHFAVQKGNVAITLELLKRHAQIHLVSLEKKTPLHFACEKGIVSIVELLLLNEGGHELLLAQDIQGIIPLFFAVSNGHLRLSHMLLQRNPKQIHVQDNDGRTVLFYSCRSGDLEMTKMLLEHGADLHVASKLKTNCLDEAILSGQIHLVQFLLEQSSSTMGKSFSSFSSSHDSTNSEPISTTNFTTSVTMKMIPPSSSTNTISPENSENQKYQAIQDDVGLENRDGYDYEKKITTSFKQLTPSMALLSATNHGQEHLVEYLIAKTKTCLQAQTENNENALHIGCKRGQLNMVKMLVEAGLDVNYKNDFGATPLFLSCAYGYPQIVELLLSKGADVELSTVEMINPLHIASQQGHLSIVSQLLQKKANTQVKTIEGWTPLHLACHSGRYKVVEILIENGADVNVCTNRGASPLMKACQLEFFDIAKLLIKHGARYNESPLQESTSMFIATKNTHKNVMQILLEKGIILPQS